MANLTIDELTETACTAASNVSEDLHVVGVTVGAGGGQYVEVLVNIEGCHRQTCKVSLGVFRNQTRSAIRLSLEARLRLHLAQQLPDERDEPR